MKKGSTVEKRKLTEAEKLEAVKAFLEISWLSEKYSLGNVVNGFRYFLNKVESVSEDIPPVDILEHCVAEHKKQWGDGRVEIDISQTTNSDQIAMALDPLRGLKALLGAMAIANDAGEHKYQLQAFEALENICADVLERFEDISSQVDYMEDRIRMCTT